MAKHDGGPAFPHDDAHWDSDTKAVKHKRHAGISVRDYFAAKANIPWETAKDACMAALPITAEELTVGLTATMLAKIKYEVSDATIAEREKGAKT